MRAPVTFPTNVIAPMTPELKPVVNQVIKFKMSLNIFRFINLFYIVQVQKISILPPQKGLEFPGGWGFCKTKNLKKCVKLYWNFQRGWGGGLRKNPFCGGGMNIFWNYTFSINEKRITCTGVQYFYFFIPCS